MHPIVEQLERSLGATLRVASAIPAERHDFRPTDRTLTAGEQIAHIAHNFDWVIAPIAAQFAIVIATNKPDTPREWLQWSQERFIGVLRQIPADGWDTDVSYPDGFAMPVARGALVMLEHDAHHRGQLIIYLHHLGIPVPKRWPKS